MTLHSVYRYRLRPSLVVDVSWTILKSIYNWRRLDDRITTSGQPSHGTALAEISALGIRHIINLGLHSHEKALPDEAASVNRLGMAYIHIPVIFRIRLTVTSPSSALPWSS